MYQQWVLKTPRKSTKILVYTELKFWRDFKEKPLAVKEHCLNAYVVKRAKSNTTHCKRLCPAGAVTPSFTRWLTARLFSGRDPRNSSWTICILTLSPNLRNWKIRKFLFIQDPSFIRTGSELFSAIDCTKDLFLPDLKYSYRILFYLYWIWNIYTGSKIFIPDPILFVPNPNLLNCCWIFQRVQISSWTDHLFENYLYWVWKHMSETE